MLVPKEKKGGGGRGGPGGHDGLILIFEPTRAG